MRSGGGAFARRVSCRPCTFPVPLVLAALLVVVAGARAPIG
jgi:hypothetical protein